MSKLISYCRVSTTQQGASGLGLEAQRAAALRYVASGGHQLVSEFVEVETGKGSNALERRPELRRALDLCKREGATLLIAKLDRLSRNVHFISGLIETGVDFIAADMPNANKTMIQMHAVMAEWERDQISARTKAALAAAKARGVKLGVAGPANLRQYLAHRSAQADTNAAKLSSLVQGFKAQGLTQTAMVNALNSAGVKTPRGCDWSLMQLQRLLKRLEAMA